MGHLLSESRSVIDLHQREPVLPFALSSSGTASSFQSRKIIKGGKWEKCAYLHPQRWTSILRTFSVSTAALSCDSKGHHRFCLAFSPGDMARHSKQTAEYRLTIGWKAHLQEQYTTSRMVFSRPSEIPLNYRKHHPRKVFDSSCSKLPIRRLRSPNYCAYSATHLFTISQDIILSSIVYSRSLTSYSGRNRNIAHW
jgi:hypothetical protein